MPGSRDYRKDHNRADDRDGSNGRLSSWKEIAAHLGVNKRTCVRWEIDFGLPVHRLEGPKKSRVYAYREELDAWLRERSAARRNNERIHRARWDAPPARARLRRLVLPVLLPAAAAVILALAAIRLLSPPVNPVDFRIEGSHFIALDAKGRSLWGRDIGVGILPANQYRQWFQTKGYNIEGSINYPLLVIRDLNRDGRNEVLLSTQTVTEIGEGELICFSRRGRELWRYKTGRELTYGSSVFSDDYRIFGIDPVDVDDDGDFEIIVNSKHRPEWPCQLTLLDHEGNSLGEYWNGGYICDYAFLDLNGDGRREIILAGIYNEFQTGFLAVLDPANMQGSSPQQKEEFRSADLERGTEKYYVTVPRTDADLIRYSSISMQEVHILSNGRIQGLAGGIALFYEFGTDMRIVDIKDSHMMQQLHKELKLQGLITSVLDADYYEDLKRRILYWDGKGWTTTPSMSNPW